MTIIARNIVKEKLEQQGGGILPLKALGWILGKALGRFLMPHASAEQMKERFERAFIR